MHNKDTWTHTSDGLSLTTPVKHCLAPPLCCCSYPVMFMCLDPWCVFMVLTHASLQPFVMSLFYSETFYELQIVQGFGDHQYNWQRNYECFSICLTLMAILQLWKGLDALKLYMSAKSVLYLTQKLYKRRLSIKQSSEQMKTNGQSVNSDLFLHFKIIPFKNALYCTLIARRSR